MTEPDGILLVDKPAGPTSHDVVDRVRRAAGTRRVGHTGTLDPFASGLLLLCLGPATRLAELFQRMDKSYEATALLGVETDSGDPEGEVVASSQGWREVDASRVEEVLAGFRGRIAQRPPALSAKKVRGMAAHRRTRRGEEVSLPSVEVEIHELELLALAPPLFRIRVRCSSGTYIRALARDVGEALGVGAHLTALRRTRVGALEVEDALPLERLGEGGGIGDTLRSAADLLPHLRRVRVNEESARKIVQGQRIPLAWEGSEGETLLILQGDRLLAVGSWRRGFLLPRKVLAQAGAS